MLNKKLGVSIAILMLGLFTIGCSKEAKAQYEEDVTEITENMTGTQDVEQDENKESTEKVDEKVVDENQESQSIPENNTSQDSSSNGDNNVEGSQSSESKDSNEDDIISKEEAIEIVRKRTGLSYLIYIDLETFDEFEHYKNVFGQKFYQIEGPEEADVFFVDIHSGVIYVIDAEARTIIPYDQWLEKVDL